MARRGVASLILVATSMVGYGCGDTETSSQATDASTTVQNSPSTTAAPTATDPPTVTEAPATTTESTATVQPATTVAETTSTSTTTAAPVAECSAAAMLPMLNGLYPENELWVIVDVIIADCQNGYARVFAVPDMTSCPDPTMPCLESEQVFLRDVAGAWEYVDSGTGIECGDAGLLPETVDACTALGLP